MLAHIGRAGFSKLVNKHCVAWMQGITGRMIKSTEEIGDAALELDKFGKEEHTTRHVHCSTAIHAARFR